jgi:Ca2+-binding RTX toxin-like protein
MIGWEQVMATASAGIDRPVDMNSIDVGLLWFGDAVIADATTIRLEYGPGNYNELRGHFTYDALGNVTGGTVNYINLYEDGSLTYEVSGFTMSLAALANYAFDAAILVDPAATERFLADLFSDPDSFVASPFADFLKTYAGNDSVNAGDGDDTVSGDAGNDTLDGGVGNDSLAGVAGNDSLIGGTGTDSMDGGAGNDTYDVDSTADLASESGVGAAGGTDTAKSSAVAYALGANIENLVLTGAADIDGTGNTLANTLTGNTGDNELSDDKGKDKLVGGDGDDTLSAGADNDTVDGGVGDDSLDGGSGDDSMAGGAGDDAYKVDSAKDKVTETLANDKNGGADTVLSSVGFTLGNNLDDLTLLDSAGPINGTGNALDNELTGNGEDNKLSGLAEADTIAGGEGNDTLDGGAGLDNMAGGGGNDSYVLDLAGDIVAEAAGEGSDTVQAAFSIDLTNAAFKNVENATLLGAAALSAKGTDADANHLTGNTGANTLEGGGGNDTLDGGKGNDSLKGGIGDDVYGIDSAKDVVAEDPSAGNDTIRSSIAVNLTTFANIENVELTGTGAINATGTEGVNNKLTGNAGANKIDGLTGDDTMDGGLGNDTYFVDSAGKDKVSEDALAGGGMDTVISEASFALSENIENLTLMGAAATGTGNVLKNTITGNDLGNTLDGGAGIDKLVGGKGDDTYFVDNAKDVVTESMAGAPGGKDTVDSSDSFILGKNVENLILTGNKNSTGTGNALDSEITGDKSNNALFGLAGNDTLEGGEGNDTVDGGAGIDDLTGGVGNDTYVLDNAADVIQESAGDSGDTAAAGFSIDLGNAKYDEIENATLLGAAALTAAGDAGNNILTGNSGANTLTGLDGNDTLDGLGGVDSLDGGKGNDVYYADSAGEKIADSGGDLEDEVRTKVTFSLANLATIENALLLGLAALSLTGNGLDNILSGNDGANKLDGAGGDDSVAGAGGNDTLDGGGGNDTLQGGAGNDVYVARGGETVVESLDEGIDTVQSALTYSIAAFANVENLTLTGTAAIGGTANAGKNTITGNSGQNALDGGAGADTMAGGTGNDSYTVDDAGDKVTEAAGGGIDTVSSSLPTYTLPANVENLMLTGMGDINGTGNTLANTLTGNDGKNVLAGDAGNDTLGGSLGADELSGGAGADTYLYATKDVQDVVNTGDKGPGVDRVLLVGNPFDWDVQRDGNDLLIQPLEDEAAADAEFDPSQAIRIVDQYAGAGIAFFQGDFGEEFNLFYGGNPDLTTVFTPSGLDGKDQGANAEVVEGTGNAETINGGGGQSDFLYGNDGDDRVNSQSGADEFAFLSGGIGADTLIGSAGADRFRGDEGDDSIDGGAGFDRASYRLSADAVSVDLTEQGKAQTISVSQGDDLLINIEALGGSKFNDTLIGDEKGNTLIGSLGNDSISGGGGSDFLVGNAGNDTLRGNALEDFVEVSYEDAKVGVIVNLTDIAQGAVAAHTAQDGLGGVDTLISIAGALGGDFGDKFFGGDADEFFEPGSGDDTIDGGDGFDDIDYFSSSDGVNASLAAQGMAQLVSTSQGVDFFTNMEGLDGSAFNDTLAGDNAGNFLQGRAGADTLSGGLGDDRLRGGAGNDTLDGGDGFDQADYFVATAAVRVDLSKQGKLQVINAAEGSDLLMNIEDVRGSSFNDTLIGDGGNNVFTGSGGNDSLAGGGGFDRAGYFDATSGVTVDLSKHGVAQLVSATEGSDVLVGIEGVSGSAFNDTLLGDSAFNNLSGRAGDDSLQGGGSQDFLVGGAGSDVVNGGLLSEFNEASFEDAPTGATVNLSSISQLGVNPGTAKDGFGTTDTLIGIAGVFGSEFNDTIFGGSGSEFFEGMGGNDSIVGGDGFGFDALEYFSSADGVSADLSKQGSAQVISATQGTDTFTGIEDIYGSFFNDSLAGDGAANWIAGRDGQDTLTGGSGADTLVGGAGNDRLLVADNSTFWIADGDDQDSAVGFDRLVITGANVNISQADVFNKFYNLEEVDLTGTGNNSMTLNALDVLQTSDTLQMRILGDFGDQVTSTGQGWKFDGTQNFEGETYNVYTATSFGNPITLFVDTDITQNIS